MREAHMIREQAQTRPAIGGGGRLPRKVLGWQAMVAVVLVLMLLIAKHVVASKQGGSDPISALPEGRTIALGIDIGGEPNDIALEALKSSYRVDGVVKLSGPDVAEQATASALNMGYLSLAVAPDAAPTLAQLYTLANFMRSTARSGSVYVHDDVGGGRAIATASMLLLLRGLPWPTVQHDVTATELKSLSERQEQDIQLLISALQSPAPGNSIHGNPYSGARIDLW